MPEVKNNGNLEDALKDLKDNVQEIKYYKKFVKENTMKNLV